MRDDAEEDASAHAAAAVAGGERPALVGLRCKSLEAATRRRAVRTLDVFLEALGPLPPGFVITLPKVSVPAQVEAMVVLCGRLEKAHGLTDGALRFEVQIETPPAILGADGTATVAHLITAAQGRCSGLHYGTYDYSASVGIAAEYQSLEHPAADHAKAVLQVAAAGTGVRLSDGSTNVLPVGDTASVRAAWDLHARLVRRSLERRYYQGWDLHPAQLPTRFGATYTFFREAAPTALDRLGRYLSRRSAGILTSRRPPGRWLASSCAGSTVVRSTRRGRVRPVHIESAVDPPVTSGAASDGERPASGPRGRWSDHGHRATTTR